MVERKRRFISILLVYISFTIPEICTQWWKHFGVSHEADASIHSSYWVLVAYSDGIEIQVVVSKTEGPYLFREKTIADAH